MNAWRERSGHPKPCSIWLCAMTSRWIVLAQYGQSLLADRHVDEGEQIVSTLSFRANCGYIATTKTIYTCRAWRASRPC